MAAIRALYLRERLTQRRHLRIRHLNDRSNPLEELSGEEVRQRFRFRPEAIVYIVSLVEDRLMRPTGRSNPLPPLLQVLIFLRFMASGAFYTVIGDGFPRVCKATVCRSVWDVINALLLKLNTFVKFPSDEHVRAVKQEFFSIAGFPNVLGVVDGTQIPIQAPSNDENDFVNRKGFHSINCQMICDPWYRITNVVAKWPGSVHDSRIFKESSLGRELQAGVHKGMLLGDSGYPCRRYLMVPYPAPNTESEIKFNKSLCKTRVMIEQTFGILKRKFGCLKGLRVAPEKACRVITTAAILHNIAVELHDMEAVEEIAPGADDNVYGGDDREEGKRFRAAITATYF